MDEENFEKYLEQDENYYFIVGFTSGGAPYGITWEQAIEEGMVDEDGNEIEDTSDEPDIDYPF